MSKDFQICLYDLFDKVSWKSFFNSFYKIYLYNKKINYDQIVKINFFLYKFYEEVSIERDFNPSKTFEIKIYKSLGDYSLVDVVVYNLKNEKIDGLKSFDMKDLLCFPVFIDIDARMSEVLSFIVYHFFKHNELFSEIK